MARLYPDPGACIVCGAAHCSCDGLTTPGPIAIAQMPARDELANQVSTPPPELPPEPVTFSTRTYSRALHGPKRPRRRETP